MMARARHSPETFEVLSMRVCGYVAAILFLTFCCAGHARAQETKVRWFGHAAFSITTPRGRVLLIDPWLRNPSNPEAKEGKDPLAAVPKVDYILLTHGHRDHVGDAVEIAKKTGAVLVCNPELAGNLVKLAGFPEKQADTDAVMGIGGEITIADGEVTVAMTPAVHSSSVYNPKAGPDEPERAYGGNPAGFVVMVKDGPVIYHSGDTAYFKDMETVGEEYRIDLALLNIGGHFGMEPRMAARAARAVRARLAVPQHYATFPGIAQDAQAFAAELKKLNVPFHEMKPGETMSFRGHVRQGASAASASSCEQCPAWNAPQKPFRVYGNTYYVGPHGLTSILITSKAGHVLIDGALPESAPRIAANIRALGFRVEDVKLIVNTHVHFDHGGGIAELQRLSGAEVAASPWSAEVLTKSGVGKGDPQFGIIPPLPLVPRATTLSDGQTLRVGDIELTAHFTPGHTPGGTSWTWRACEGVRCIGLVYSDSLTPVSAEGFRFNDGLEYPDAVRDFEKSFAFLRTTPCDILLTSHPDASNLWQRLEGRERGVRPDPLVSPKACKELAARAAEQLRRRLESEKSR